MFLILFFSFFILRSVIFKANTSKAVIFFTFFVVLFSTDKCGSKGKVEEDIFSDIKYECIRDVECDDGLYCNGAEWCDPKVKCMKGEPVDCSALDEGCFKGVCDEETKGCVKKDICKCWMKTYGGNSYDISRAISQTDDQGFVVAGETWSKGAGLADVWIIKIDQKGDMQWDRTFGGSKQDRARAVKQTDDGGYIVGGVKDAEGVRNEDGWVMKLNADGKIQWDKVFISSESDSVESILQTNDRGYVFAGYWNLPEDQYSHFSRFWVVKMDESGDVVWEKKLGKDGTDSLAYSISGTNDGGFVAAGETGSGTTICKDLWVVKFDSEGNSQWDFVYEGNNTFDHAESVQQTFDGGYILAGFTSKATNPDYCFAQNEGKWRVIKIDSKGNIHWNKTYGKYGWAYDILQTSDGGYVATGPGIPEDVPYTGQIDIWLVKFDQDGNIVWDRIFSRDYDDIAKEIVDMSFDIEKTFDDGFVIAGYSETKETLKDPIVQVVTIPDFIVIKTDSQGYLCE